MATPRLARISRSLLKASISSLEDNENCRSVLLRCTTARGSIALGHLGQLAGRIDPADGKGLPTRPAGVEATLGQADQTTGLNNSKNSSVGGAFWRSMEVFPLVGTYRINSSSKFSTTRSLAAGGSAMKVKNLDHVVLTVKDIEATCQFYSDVLGMEVVKFGASDGGTRVALAFGEQKINLHQVGKEFEPKAHRATAGSADLCFITDAPLDHMLKHIESNGVNILQGPVGRAGALGAIRSVYFRDPDLNLIEVSNYV